MIIFPETRERMDRYFRALEGKAEVVPILAQVSSVPSKCQYPP